MIDTILKPADDRFVLFPIKYQTLWDHYKQLRAVDWLPEEIDYESNLVDWQVLTSDEQHFIKMVLAFFAASDGIVNENLCFRFAKEVQIAEARQFYSCQIMNEAVHSETYSLLINSLISDVKERDKLFNAIEHYDFIKAKADWSLKWLNSETASFGERLVAFAAVEGILFSGSFCSIYWLKKRGLMHGLCQSNEFISRDEGYHCDFAIELHNHLENKVPHARITEILTEAVEIEKQFITGALPVSLIGMNSEKMTQYIEFVCDFWLTEFGCAKYYNSTNPFPWMEMISMKGKTNFFERRVTEYQDQTAKSSKQVISYNEEF